jgi:hypothetical protein
MGGYPLRLTTQCVLLQYEHLIKEDVLVMWWVDDQNEDGNKKEVLVSPLLQL